MLKQFIELSDVTGPEPKELDLQGSVFTTSDINTINEVIYSLDTVAALVEGLGNRNCNLMKTDEMLSFLFEELPKFTRFFEI